MNISVIGTGAIGGTIAQKLAQAGHQVKIANSKGKESLTEFAQSIGVEASDLENIAQNTEVLILSVPFSVVKSLPKAIFETLPTSAIVVDTGNYYPEFRDENIAEIDNGTPESLWVSEQIGRKVIKAFNALLAFSLQHLGKKKGETGRLAMQVSGDDEHQKKIVMQLVEDCGFEAFDNGNLQNSWSQQPNSAGYCCDYTAEELREIKQKSAQNPQVIKERRAFLSTQMGELLNGDFSHENVIKINRKYNQ